MTRHERRERRGDLLAFVAWGAVPYVAFFLLCWAVRYG